LIALSDIAADRLRNLRFILCDIDDTVTTEGKLTARAYSAMERLAASGLSVIPITGRPGGWCDHIARMWPVAGVVGENGAFYFRYDAQRRVMQRRFWLDETARSAARARLERLRAEIVAAVPRAGIASDQPYREADLAIDFAEDVGPLDRAEIDRIVAMFEAAGARAKVSSIHVNGWFGDFDKLAMTRVMMREVFAVDLDRDKALPLHRRFAERCADVRLLPFVRGRGECARFRGPAAGAAHLCHARTRRGRLRRNGRARACRALTIRARWPPAA